MPNIKLSDFANSDHLEDYEKTMAALKLMSELEKGRMSGEQEGWHDLEEVCKELGIVHI
jgi:hypothetical protein